MTVCRRAARYCAADMTVYLVRHADAKGRSAWEGADRLRPLTKKGLQQSVGLVDLLSAANIRRILSSPAVRCVDTVKPLASARDLPVEVTDDLKEGADLKAALALLEASAGKKGDSVLCLHGDLIPEMLRRLAKQGVKLEDTARWAKGSTWVLSAVDGQIVSGRYLDPP